jgi:hypothetical protein
MKYTKLNLKRRFAMRIGAPAILTIAACLSAPVSADLVFTNTGPFDSAGAVGDAANTTFSETNNSATPIYSSYSFSGNLTEINTATWGSEARFNLTNSSGYDATFQPTTTNDFDGTLAVNAVTSGAFWAPEVGAYEVETFESFDDGAGVDATWTDVSFEFFGLPTVVELGEYIFGTNFIFDTEGSDFDTELGGLTGSGLLLDNDDDSGTGLLSLLNLGTLAVGDYYLALGGFDTIFANYVVTGGSASGGYNINLNGQSIDAGRFGGGVNLLHFQVTDVPEPGSVILVGLALAFMARRRRNI